MPNRTNRTEPNGIGIGFGTEPNGIDSESDREPIPLGSVRFAPPTTRKTKGGDSSPPFLVADGRIYFFFLVAFFGEAFLAFFICDPPFNWVICRRLPSAHEKSGRVIGPPPLSVQGAYFFFFAPPFLAAPFFLAGILEIPPFGPSMDRGQPLSRSRVTRAFAY
jgi:hypothetical protein